MISACGICTEVGANVKKSANGVRIAQRKKNLGLLAASYVGHVDCVEFFIKDGADLNCVDGNFNRDCRRKLCRKVRRQIYYYAGAPWTEMNHGNNWTPLMYASENNLHETAKVLIKAGADVNLVKSNVNALVVAAEMVHYKCIEVLIEAGANVNISDPTIPPPLICAAYLKTEDVVNSKKSIEILIKAGADVNVRFIQGVSQRITTPLLEMLK